MGSETVTPSLDALGKELFELDGVCDAICTGR